MKKEPTTMVGLMVILLSVILLLICFGSNNLRLKQTVIISVMFLQMSLLFVYIAFKHQQKRIDSLEEKLNQQEEKQDQQDTQNHVNPANPVKESNL